MGLFDPWTAWDGLGTAPCVFPGSGRCGSLFQPGAAGCYPSLFLPGAGGRFLGGAGINHPAGTPQVKSPRCRSCSYRPGLFTARIGHIAARSALFY